MNKLAFGTIFILLFAIVISGQKKEKIGHLYGHVVLETPNERRGELFPEAIIELLHLKKRIIITSDEVGMIDEDLPVGKYQLLSVKNAEGKQLTFSKNQNLYFEIKANKTIRFDIGVLKP